MTQRAVAKMPYFRSLTGLFGALCLLAASTAAHASSQAGDFDLARYRGKVVYLDFWASWCGPCKLSFPFLERLAADYGRQNVVVIAVNLDHSKAKADAFLQQVQATIPVVYDPTGILARKYGVKEMPTSVVIGPDGRTRFVHNGFFPQQMPLYEAHISELLHGN